MKISQLQQDLQKQQELRSESIQQLHGQSLQNLEKSLTELHQDMANKTEKSIITAYNNLADSVEKQSKIIQEKLQEESEKPKDWQNLGIYASLGFGIAILIFLFWRNETNDYQTKQIKILEAWQIPQEWRATDKKGNKYIQVNYKKLDKEGRFYNNKSETILEIKLKRR